VYMELQALHPFPCEESIPPLDFAPFWFQERPTGVSIIVVYRPDTIRFEMLESFVRALRRVAYELTHAPGTRVESLWASEKTE
jgi:hypothetical protein